MTSKPRTARHSESGEMIARRTTRNRMIIFGLLFGVGLAAGIAAGNHAADNGFGGTWPPAISIGTAILYVIAIIAGSVALSRVTDEVERAQSYKAVALAGAGYVLAYPVWFLLWKGGVAAEPIHWVLFVGFWLLLAGGTIFYRFR